MIWDGLLALHGIHILRFEGKEKVIYGKGDWDRVSVVLYERVSRGFNVT